VQEQQLELAREGLRWGCLRAPGPTARAHGRSSGFPSAVHRWSRGKHDSCESQPHRCASEEPDIIRDASDHHLVWALPGRPRVATL
jgi:hypothetical protein